MNQTRSIKAFGLLLAGIITLAMAAPSVAMAADGPLQGVEQTEKTTLQKVLGANGENTAAGPIQLIVILALASLAPAIVLSCTTFVRFIIVFSFLKTGLATQGAPPQQILTGLCLFMTLFVMAPVASEIHTKAFDPYMNGEIKESQALELATPPLRRFLLERTRPQDLSLFYEVSGLGRPSSPDDVPLRIAIPAFMLSELGTAFRMGLVILLPFLVIEIVVASLLSALGMVMLPPPIIAMPVKLLVFVVVDGWHLLVSSLLKGVT